MIEFRYTYDSEWIHKLETETHWRAYWHQQKLMENLVQPNDKVMEIGVGSGFTKNYLKSRGVDIIAVDIDADKRPDITANIVEYDFPDKYDHILAFEVFEHIPYEEFEASLKKISKAVNKYLFVSVPVNEKVWLRNELYLHVFGNFKFKISTLRNRLTTQNHFWEVKYKKFSKKKIEESFKKHNFSIKRSFKFNSQVFYCFEKL